MVAIISLLTQEYKPCKKGTISKCKIKETNCIDLQISEHSFQKGHGKYSCRQKLNSIKAQVNYEINIYIIYVYFFPMKTMDSSFNIQHDILTENFNRSSFVTFNSCPTCRTLLKNRGCSFLPGTAYLKRNYID